MASAVWASLVALTGTGPSKVAATRLVPADRSDEAARHAVCLNTSMSGSTHVSCVNCGLCCCMPLSDSYKGSVTSLQQACVQRAGT